VAAALGGRVMTGLGRFNEPGILILASLADGPKHGYALIKDIEEFAGSKLGPGTLYAALTRLESSGLIQALPEQDRRRPYQLTAAGAQAARAYLRQARQVTAVGLARLEGYAW
jgi:DNA-binding PadR family transcriptional regulator